MALEAGVLGRLLGQSLRGPRFPSLLRPSVISPLRPKHSTPLGRHAGVLGRLLGQSLRGPRFPSLLRPSVISPLRPKHSTPLGRHAGVLGRLLGQSLRGPRFPSLLRPSVISPLRPKHSTPLGRHAGVLGRLLGQSLRGPRFPSLLRPSVISPLRPKHSTPLGRHGRGFGLVLDIDGVLCRGRHVLPGVVDAFKDYILDERGKFTVPTVFVTNAGNMKRQDKAQQLAKKIGIEIDEEQMIMSHSPLKMFTQFHNQHVLVCGQGPVLEIAHMLGFKPKRVTTIDDLRAAFPGYDCVDHARRIPEPLHAYSEHFEALDAVILFGEPVRWETALQYLVDVLLTGGRLRDPMPTPGPHIPVLACNIDLLFSAETAPMPRFAHGSFLLCLEALYHKMSGGRDLRYSALMGKPSELTYHHAEYCIQREASKIGIPCPHTIYAIGDNPESDILGANIFQQYLNHRKIQNQHMEARKAAEKEKLEKWKSGQSRLPTMSYDRESIDNTAKYLLDYGVTRCHSVLVETGVYSAKNQMQGVVSNFHLRELAKNTLLKTPSFSEPDLLHAIQMIWERESYMERASLTPLPKPASSAGL